MMLRILALFSAVALNVTPLFDVRNMIMTKSTGSLVPLPYCAMLSNASLWTLYGVSPRKKNDVGKTTSIFDGHDFFCVFYTT